MDLTSGIIQTRDVLAKHQVEYMFIGKGAAILQGFSDMTQDIDIYPDKKPENSQRLVNALTEIGFVLSPEQKEEILKGKDFVQLESPFALDIVFAPDGFESYDDACKYRRIREETPVLSIEGIIKSKKAAGRERDKESLPRLIQFKEYLDGRER